MFLSCRGDRKLSRSTKFGLLWFDFALTERFLFRVILRLKLKWTENVTSYFARVV